MAANEIDDEGFVELLNSLENSAKSGSLSSMNISENYISRTDTVTALITFIVHAKSLKILDISQLEIGKAQH